jgi:hypothetical protein
MTPLICLSQRGGILPHPLAPVKSGFHCDRLLLPASRFPTICLSQRGGTLPHPPAPVKSGFHCSQLLLPPAIPLTCQRAWPFGTTRRDFTTPLRPCQIRDPLWQTLLPTDPMSCSVKVHRLWRQRSGILSHTQTLVKSEPLCDLWTKRPADPFCNLLVDGLTNPLSPATSRLRFLIPTSLYQRTNALSRANETKNSAFL